MSESSGRVLNWIALVVLILIWGTTWAAIRVGLEGIPPWTGVALRFSLAALLLFVVAKLARVTRQRDRRLYALWAIEAGLAFSLSYGIVYWAEQWVPSGLAAVLFSTFPLFVALLAHFLLPEEPLSGRGVSGVLVGFVGILVIFSEDLSQLGGEHVAFAAAVFLISPFVSALAHVMVKKWGGGYHPLNLMVVPMALTAVLMGAVALASEHDRTLELDTVSVGAVLYLAIFGTATTFTIYYWLLARIKATQLALITYGIPLVAVMIGVVFLDERLATRTVLGGLLVIGGVAVAAGSRRG